MVSVNTNQETMLNQTVLLFVFMVVFFCDVMILAETVMMFRVRVIERFHPQRKYFFVTNRKPLLGG